MSIVDVRDFEAPLRLCYESLTAPGQGFIAEGRLADLRRRVAVFGLTLAQLDIRQDAAGIRRRSARLPPRSASAVTRTGTNRRVSIFSCASWPAAGR